MIDQSIEYPKYIRMFNYDYIILEENEKEYLFPVDKSYEQNENDFFSYYQKFIHCIEQLYTKIINFIYQ